MIGAKKSEANCVQYELEIAIDASRERVWKAIFEETNFWWLPDFHMVGEGSVVTFDTAAGGAGLVEHLEGGGGLLWYQVTTVCRTNSKSTWSVTLPLIGVGRRQAI